MKKAFSIAALVGALGFLAVAWMPSEARTPQVDEAAFNAQVDMRLHTLLARMARNAEATGSQQLATR
ncbi:MAG: hypothetical protein HY901_37100 [Deltaproteobacteria bacterium]|nr:hypothetical protein [Deltaproteobacteria bacterium]